MVMKPVPTEMWNGLSKYEAKIVEKALNLMISIAMSVEV